MRALWPVFLLFFSALAQAVVGNCPSNFPDGLQSPYSGTAASKGIIDFGFNAQLLSNPDSVLAAKTVNRNGGSTLLTCNSANCTASGSTAPTQDAGTFPTTSGYTTVLDVPFNTTQSLAGNGSNQYKTINLNAQTQLTINSSGQSFYIDQLSISSGSILRLAPGDYWVRSLNVGFQSQIQVQGSGLVRLFVRDNWALSSSALLNSPAINSSGTANNLYLYNYGSFILNNQATLSGYVYSANQQGSNQAISLDSPSYVFGALSGENISLATDARVNYVAPAGSCVVVSSKYWWAMDEAQWSGATGEVLESSGSGLTGRGLGGAQTASATPALSNSPGTCGYGTYSGTSSRVEVADNSGLDFSTELSAGLWVRPTATPTATVVLLGKGTNYQLALNSSRQLVLTSRFVYGLGAGSSETLTVTTPIGSALPLNQWTHVGFSLDFFEAFFVADYIAGKIFINGVQSGSGQTSAQFFGATVVNSAVLQIGGSGSTGLVGWVDEVRLDQSVLLASNFADQMVYRHNCPVQASVDHYELVYASNQALTCNPLSVTLKACQNSACSSLYSGSVSASLTPAGVPNNWSSNPVTFTGNSALQFQRTNLGSAVLGVSATPTASNATQCIVGGVSGNCTVTFADSGFIFNVPNALAAKPVSTTINAVKADPANPQACIPGFASGARSVAFTRSYSNPNTGTQSVSVNGTPVTSATPVTLNFDATATAQLTVQYNDAGEMALAAKYAPTSGLENGLDMNGSDLFVSRPYGLLLQTDTLSSCTLAGISCPLYPGSVRAGDSFNLKIKAVAWQSDGEPLTVAALADNPATPNFQLSNIALSSQLLAPAGGSAGTLGVGSYSHVLGTVANSNSTTVSQSVSEVGVFTLTATPPVNGYFGDTVNASVSGLVGRFAPAYLSSSGSASLTPSCGAAFSYQGQPMAFAVGQEPSLTVTGKNRSGGVTNNYDRGDFWRLGIPTREPYLSVTTKASIDAVGRLTSSPAVSPVQSGADSGDGARSYRWSGETLQYSPAVLPLTDDLPFTAAVRQGFSAAALTDADAVCNGVGSSCLAFSYDFTNVPGSEVRLGRLRLSNAHGSELQGLALPFNLETWQAVAGASFQAELTDSCTTALVLGTPELSSHAGNLAVGETLATVSGPLAAAGQLRLSAPGAGNDGSVQGSFPALPTWLHYDWDATGLSTGRRAASGLVRFGIYQGAKPLIFRRELYRTP